MGIYCGQELLEGFLAAGHPAGLAGILGHGGWIAAPVAVSVGGALAAALRLADTAVALTERRSRSRRAVARATAVTVRPRARYERDWRLEPHAGVVAGRAPPAAISLG